MALQGLCCHDVQGPKVADLIDEFLTHSRDDEQTVAMARKLIAGVLADLEPCDAALDQHAQHWEMGRLALVDRNILRLAVHELRAAAAPIAVIISEGVKLAQEFSTAESPRFVNGVLDAIAKGSCRDAGDSGDEEADSGDGTEEETGLRRDAGDSGDEETDLGDAAEEGEG